MLGRWITTVGGLGACALAEAEAEAEDRIVSVAHRSLTTAHSVRNGGTVGSQENHVLAGDLCP